MIKKDLKTNVDIWNKLWKKNIFQIRFDNEKKSFENFHNVKIVSNEKFKFAYKINIERKINRIFKCNIKMISHKYKFLSIRIVLITASPSALLLYTNFLICGEITFVPK